jgi:hypothetical protein
MMLM